MVKTPLISERPRYPGVHLYSVRAVQYYPGRRHHMVEVKWTPSADAGSMRFSSKMRDPASYAGKAWARRDRPFWMPEAVAALVVDELDWPDWAAHAALVALVVALCAAVRELLYWLRLWRSERAVRQLIGQEKAAAAARVAEKNAAVAAAAAAAAALPTTATAMMRYCRFCDVPVEDTHMTTHEAGKRHKRLKDSAGALGAGECWVMRPSSEAAPEPAASEQRAAAPSAPRCGGGDGGRGGWTTTKRRR